MLRGQTDSEWRAVQAAGELRSGSVSPGTGGPDDICFHSQPGAGQGGAVRKAHCQLEGLLHSIYTLHLVLWLPGSESMKACLRSHSSIWAQGRLQAP